MFGLYYDIWCVDPGFGDGGGFWVVYDCFHVDGVAFFVLEFTAGRAAGAAPVQDSVDIGVGGMA